MIKIQISINIEIFLFIIIFIITKQIDIYAILIIPVIESFLLAKEQIFSLKQKFNLDNQIVRQLYINNNIYFLNILFWNPGFDLIMILNKPNINIDDEFIESIKLLSKDLYIEKKGLKDESSAYSGMLTITSLSEIILVSLETIKPLK